MSNKKNLPTDNFGSRLQQYRIMKKLTGNQLAEIIGISQGSLSELENGKREPSAKVFQGIAEKTEIDIKWLITGKGEKPEPTDYSFYEELEQWAKEFGGSENVDWLRNMIENVFPIFKEWKKRKAEGNGEESEFPSSKVA